MANGDAGVEYEFMGNPDCPICGALAGTTSSEPISAPHDNCQCESQATCTNSSSISGSSTRYGPGGICFIFNAEIEVTCWDGSTVGLSTAIDMGAPAQGTTGVGWTSSTRRRPAISRAWKTGARIAPPRTWPSRRWRFVRSSSTTSSASSDPAAPGSPAPSMPPRSVAGHNPSIGEKSPRSARCFVGHCRIRPALLILIEVEDAVVVADVCAAAGWPELVDLTVPNESMDGYDVAIAYDPATFGAVSDERSFTFENRFATRDLLMATLHLDQSHALTVLASHWASRTMSNAEILRIGAAIYCTNILERL